MIGHHARFRENDDLPIWRGPAAKNKFNARALIVPKWAGKLRSLIVKTLNFDWPAEDIFVTRTGSCKRR